MNVLYISSLSSTRLLTEIKEKTNINPGYAIQKFNRLVAKSLNENVENITVLSNPPVVNNFINKRFFYNENEEEKGLNIKYIPFVNYGRLKHVCVLIYAFLYTFFWGLGNRKKRFIVCDVLSVSASLGSLFATKILKIKSVAIVTDLPWLVVPEGETPQGKPKHTFLSYFTHYIFLTQQMNEVINDHRRPYIVMEGLADFDDKAETQITKDKPKTVLYAGTLMAKYGLKMLVDSFVSLGDIDAQLVIYGDGPYAEELKEVCARNCNVIYKGFALTDEVVEAEKRATILVNPRPTYEEYTKYSFPSKNMEYMASGTPLLTTKLPGIPKEYDSYIYYFESETNEGFAKALKDVLSLPDEFLKKKGEMARNYVRKNKNVQFQGARILNLIKQ